MGLQRDLLGRNKEHSRASVLSAMICDENLLSSHLGKIHGSGTSCLKAKAS